MKWGRYEKDFLLAHGNFIFDLESMEFNHELIHTGGHGHLLINHSY